MQLREDFGDELFVSQDASVGVQRVAPRPRVEVYAPTGMLLVLVARDRTHVDQVAPVR